MKKAAQLLYKKYKTFSVLVYRYINTSGNWKNEKLCGNTTPAGRSVFTKFRAIIYTIDPCLFAKFALMKIGENIKFLIAEVYS